MAMLANIRHIKCLTVVDDFSRECVDIAIDYGMGGQYVSRQTGDLHLLGVHVHLRQVSARGVPAPTQDTKRPRASDASGAQGATEGPHAPRHSRTGSMAEGGGHGVLRVSRSAHER